MLRTIKIGNRLIGEGQPCFIVAEAGANHEGQFQKALELVDAALSTKADAIKFQHYTAGKLASKEARRYWFVRGDEKGYQFDPSFYKETQIETFAKIDGIPRGKDAELFDYAWQKGIVPFSTPFDFASVDHLEKLGAPMYKIASGDLTYHQLLAYVARTGKPIVLSTGAASLDEIRSAVNVIKKAGNNQIILLHCTLAYPTPLENINLLMMKHLQEEFPDVMIGLSDHTPGVEADAAASILGAVMIEKHFTHTPGAASGANRVGESPDHDIGLGTVSFTEMVRRVREDEKQKLSVRYGLSFEKAVQLIKSGQFLQVLGGDKKVVDEKVELKARAQARRSVVAALAMQKGMKITQEMLGTHFEIKRPGTGIAPFELEKLVGKTLKADVASDAVMRWEHFA